MTINTLIRTSGLSRYYVTKAAKASGIEIRRGRKPTEFSLKEARKIQSFLRKVISIKQ